MPRNPTTGVFTRVSNSFSEPVQGTIIDPSDADALFNDQDDGMTFNDAWPLILIGSTSGILTILAPNVASGTLTLPAGTTDFSMTGGTNYIVRQDSAGAPFTVGPVPFANMAAWTIKGNATGSSAAPSDFTIAGLTHKASPTTNDLILISDTAASATFKYSTLAEAFAGVSPGVLSINALTGVLTGILTSTRLAKTAAYTVAAGDVGSTIALGGTAFYALTFGPASGYASPWSVRVLNSDTTRGKLLLTTVDTSSSSLAIGTGSKAFTITAGLNITAGDRYTAWSAADNTNWMSGPVASYSGTTLTLTADTVGGSGTKTDWQIGKETILWPQQSVVIENQNNIWNIFGLVLYRPATTPQLNVDSSGSDRNDGFGTTTGALKTLTRAVVIAQANFYSATGTVIDGGSGTFQEFVTVYYPLNGGGTLLFQNFTWKPTNSGYCMQFGDNALVGLTNITASTAGTTTPVGLFSGHQMGVLDVNANFVITPTVALTGSCFDTDGDTRFNINNGMTINAGTIGGFLYKGASNSDWNINGTHTFVGTPSITRWAWATMSSTMVFQGNVAFSGANTTNVSLVNQNGCIQNLSGATLPGGTPTPTTGGQYNTTSTA